MTKTIYKTVAFLQMCRLVSVENEHREEFNHLHEGVSFRI